MIIHVLTLFPGMFAPVISESMLGKANERGLLDLDIINIRDFTQNKHKKTDDTPFGGGAGMVMNADPVFRALESIPAEGKRIFYMSPRGRQLDQSLIQEISQLQEITILCGHYEGVDQRVLDYWKMEEITIGDYILTGGELPAMVLIDAVARLVPEVLGSPESLLEESIYSGLLEYPHYTKPREYRGLEVPPVLTSGNHRNIHLWKLEQSLRLTRRNRPDLFEKYVREKQGVDKGLDKEERSLLRKVLESKDE